MNRFTKALVGIMAIITILQVLWFVALLIDIPGISRYVAETFSAGSSLTDGLVIVFSVCALIFAICALALITFTRTTESDLVFKNNQGKMTISRKTVEKMVNQSASANLDLGNINSSIKLFNGGKQAHVHVEAVALSDNDFQLKAQQLQSTVNSNLQRYLGIESKTKVHIIPRSAASDSLKVN